MKKQLQKNKRKQYKNIRHTTIKHIRKTLETNQTNITHTLEKNTGET